MRLRSHALLVWLAAVALVAPQLGMLADSLHNEHTYCATHDDFVHGEAEHTTLALRAVSSGAGKTHTHCDVWKTGLRPAESVQKRVEPRTPTKAAETHRIDDQPAIPAPFPIWAQAPKHSPPARHV